VSIKLSRLVGTSPIVDKDGKPSLTFARYWQSFAEQIERAINGIADVLGITDQLDQAIQAAQQAASSAQDAAAASAAATVATKREQALVNSYIEPATVLTATPTTISVAAHTRMYADGTSAPVSSGTIAATTAGDTDYVFYTDPERDGGAVTYQVRTTPPVQTGDTHVVGAVEIPATGTVDGGEGPRRPGYVTAKFIAPEE
jgi:tetrahydromethanopterin S-methyltransferase subunit H